MMTTCWIFPEAPDGLGEGAGVGDGDGAGDGVGVGDGLGLGFGVGFRLRADAFADGFFVDDFVERVIFGFLIPAPV